MQQHIKQLMTNKMTPTLFQKILKDEASMVIGNTREMIETMQFDYLESWVQTLCATEAAKNQVFFFSIQGYDEDPRELYQIEEVDAYIKRFFSMYPELYYFLDLEQSIWIYGCLTSIDEPKERIKKGLRCSPILSDLFVNLLEQGIKNIPYLTEAERIMFIERFNKAYKLG